MALEAGRITLRWGMGYSASVEAAASNSDIEAAIRNAIKLPPVPPIHDKPAVIAEAAKANGATTMSTNDASAGASVKQMIEEHTRMMGEIQQAQLRILGHPCPAAGDSRRRRRQDRSTN